jgi:hypothetical protein
VLNFRGKEQKRQKQKRQKTGREKQKGSEQNSTTKNAGRLRKLCDNIEKVWTAYIKRNPEKRGA